MSVENTGQARELLLDLVWASVAIGLTGAAGAMAVHLVEPSIHSPDFLWISGRALGIAAYVALFLLELLGIWIRHPWRFRVVRPHPEARLRAHGALAVATTLLVTGHLVSLAMDRYAGVGWWGALIPGMSHYRRGAVAFGVVGFLALVLISATAGLSGRVGTRHWLGIHRCAALVFAVVWAHGVLAGADSALLRPMYVATGVIWLVALSSRLMAAPTPVAS